jgi:hypothetical protein
VSCNNATASADLNNSLVEFDCPDTAIFADTILTCSTESINLNTFLPGQVDPFGYWLTPFGSPVAGGWISPAADVPGVYSYNWIDSEGCFLYGTVAVFFTQDSDNDGICNDDEIVGCQDPTAENYNPEATDPGPCVYGLYEFDLLSEIMLPEDSELGGRPAPDFSIYPNPIKNGDLTIVFSEPIHGGGQVRMYDLLGKVVFQYTIKKDLRSIVISASHFPAKGVYVISTRNEEGDFSHRKVMVTK